MKKDPVKQAALAVTKEWILARIKLAERRLQAIDGNKSIVAVYERDQHLNDISRLHQMLGFHK